MHRACLPVCCAALISVAQACSSDDTAVNENGSTSSSTAEESGSGSQTSAASDDSDGFLVASVVITEAGRTTYFQVSDGLSGHITNSSGVEIPGNAVYLVDGRTVLVGLAEEPTWVKYTINADGSFSEAGRMSLMSYGLTSIDFGNALVDSTTAVSISSDALAAIVWNPQTMTITGTVDLSHMFEEGFDLENWTTVASGGLVYVPARWANWDEAVILPKVMTTIIDPVNLSVLGIAEDDRCASGGRIVFDEAGYGYVMGDGRNYSQQMFAQAKGMPAPANCLLRIPPGETQFDPDYFHAIPSLTDGLEVITELYTAQPGSGVGFAKMFYVDELPADVAPVDFQFWGENAHKMWRIELGDEPTARPVERAPFSAIGFNGVAAGGILYQGESEDGGGTSTVYAVDPVANTMDPVFTMDGFFYGAHPLPDTGS